MTKNFEIRNSTAEFLTFVATGKEDGIQVLYKDETVWATQKAMATLFDVDRSVITKHLKNIFDSEELEAERVCAKFAHTAEDGKTYNTMFYNLDAIISVGYRVNSIQIPKSPDETLQNRPMKHYKIARLFGCISVGIYG